MADPSLEDLRKLMETAEGREALKNILEMETDGGGTRPMQLAPEFVDDTIDEVGYDPDVDQIDIGASQYIPGANRAVPMDQSMTFEEMERRKMLAQLMANQQTRTA